MERIIPIPTVEVIDGNCVDNTIYTLWHQDRLSLISPLPSH